MLSIIDVTKATEGYSKPIVEGKAYYDSGLLFGVGLKEKSGRVFTCQRLAVQTSAVSGKPHEIIVRIDTEKGPGQRVLSLVRSCIAGHGQSSKCKHAVATLLWLTRHTEDDMTDLSYTEIEQQWDKLKTSNKPVMEGCPIAELCHVKEKKSPDIPDITEEMRETWKEALMKCKSNY